MAESKVPVRKEKLGPSSTPQAWQPFENLRREVDRLFDNFGWGAWQPFRQPLFAGEPLFRRATMPAIDVSENEKGYEITAELPGMDEKNIEVKVNEGSLTIKGEKRDEKEERDKGYYLQERHYGSFERSFELPDSVDAEKVEATFKQGVLTVALPKKAEAQKPAKKIEIKS
jgi:HSP20 family protein